jgi:hypothetical protein
MTRRRAVMLGAAVVSAVALLLVPSAASSSGGGEPPPASVRHDGDRPPVTRCDPQPDRGIGPPAGKGKKCASA